MLIKHSFHYLLARGVPGIINFGSLAVFTRLLSPEKYGQYALVIAGTGMMNAVLFQWLRLGLLRYWPSYENTTESKRFLSTLTIAYLGMVLLTAIAGICLLLLVPSQQQRFVALGVGLLWLQAWYELQLEFNRSKLAIRKYSVLMLAKTVLALGAGFALITLGAGASGPLIGLGIGMLLPLLLGGTNELSLFRLTYIDWEVLRRLLTYGTPLTVTFALGFIVSSSDRLLLGWMQGAEKAGLYAVGYDLAQFTVGMLMMIVNLAGYPLVVRTLEQNGLEAARKKLQQNGLLLIAIALPACAGLTILAENISMTLLGTAFQTTATQLIPFIALAALMAGLSAYYFNLAFQLGNHTLRQIWIALAAAIINVLLNLWWIPTIGIVGAAYATLVAYILAFCLSWILGSHIFPMPPPHKDIPKVMMASVVMAVSLISIAHFHGLFALIVQIVVGATLYCMCLLLLNVASCREGLFRFLQALPSGKQACTVKKPS